MVGISGIPTFGENSFNENNVRSGYSSIARISYYSLQPYFGLELNPRNPRKETFRNYFSVSTTVGFNLSDGNELTPEILYDGGVTNNGDAISNVRYTVEQGRFLSPSFQLALRYHITNRNGKEILLLELQTNYNLTRYFSYTYRYQINGVDRVGFVAEKGFNIQFNVIIPLIKFGKKGHEL